MNVCLISANSRVQLLFTLALNCDFRVDLLTDLNPGGDKQAGYNDATGLQQ